MEVWVCHPHNSSLAERVVTSLGDVPTKPWLQVASLGNRGQGQARGWWLQVGRRRTSRWLLWPRRGGRDRGGEGWPPRYKAQTGQWLTRLMAGEEATNVQARDKPQIGRRSHMIQHFLHRLAEVDGLSLPSGSRPWQSPTATPHSLFQGKWPKSVGGHPQGATAYTINVIWKEEQSSSKILSAAVCTVASKYLTEEICWLHQSMKTFNISSWNNTMQELGIIAEEVNLSLNFWLLSRSSYPSTTLVKCSY